MKFLHLTILLTVHFLARASDIDTTLKAGAMIDLQSRYDDYKKIAMQIWDYAEMG